MLKNPFGLKDGVIVKVEDVSRGLECGCLCPNCGDQLISRQGQEKVWHFAHENEECTGAVEAAVHMMVHDHVLGLQSITIPEFVFHLPGKSWVEPVRSVEIDGATSINLIEGSRKDIELNCGGQPLLVHLAIGHESDDQKRELLRERGLSAITIDLSPFMLTPSTFSTEAVASGKHSSWLHNESFKQARIALKSTTWRKKRVTSSKKVYKGRVYDCPLQTKPKSKTFKDVTVSIDAECANCPHLAFRSPESILCIGKYKVDSLSKMRAVAKRLGL